MGQFIVPLEVQRSLHQTIINQIDKLSDESKRDFVNYYIDKRKSVVAAYLFGILLGAHYGYVRRWAVQVIFWVSVMAVVGLVWWVIDLFRIPGVVRNYNDDLAIDILNKLKF